MRPSLLLTALALAGSFCASGQYFEAGVSVGAANYAGDLSDGDFLPAEYRGAIGLFTRYNYNERLAARATVTLGSVQGADARSHNAPQVSRNLDFESPLAEVAVMGEFNVLPYAPRNHDVAALYVTAGVAGFRFNPTTTFNGETVELQPLQTEGVSYSRISVAIPFGGGLKVNLTDRLNLGLEVIARKTFTDYLDDVSGDYADVDAQHAADPRTAALSFRAPQYTGEALENPVGTARGNVAGDDFYLTALLSVGFNLTTKQGMDFDGRYAIFKTPPQAARVQGPLGD